MELRLTQVSGTDKDSQHIHKEGNQTIHRSTPLIARGKVKSCSAVKVVGDRIIEWGCPVARGVFEVTKQLLCGWSSRRRFTPTRLYQPPQCVRETQRLGIIRLFWMPPFLYSDHHCAVTEAMKRSEASQNLVTGK